MHEIYRKIFFVIKSYYIFAFLIYSWGSLSRDLFKKISNTKGTFRAKMGTIKDRNGMDLTEAEDIKKRWEELYKKRS